MVGLTKDSLIKIALLLLVTGIGLSWFVSCQKGLREEESKVEEPKVEVPEEFSWVAVAQSKEGDTYYVDRRNLFREGETVKFWYQNVEKKEGIDNKIYTQADCPSGAYEIKKWATYEWGNYKMGSESKLRTETAQPNSAIAALISTACSL